MVFLPCRERIASCVSEPTMRVVAWCWAFPETLVLLKEKESEPTLVPLDQELVLFHAHVGEARVLTSSRS